MFKQGSLGLPVTPINTARNEDYLHCSNVVNSLRTPYCEEIECFGYSYKIPEQKKLTDLLIDILYELQQLDDIRIISGLTATAQVFSQLVSKGWVDTILICLNNQTVWAGVGQPKSSNDMANDDRNRPASSAPAIATSLRVAYQIHKDLGEAMISAGDKDENALEITQKAAEQIRELLQTLDSPSSNARTRTQLDNPLDPVDVVTVERDSEEANILGREAKRLKQLLKVIREDSNEAEDSTDFNAPYSERSEDSGVTTCSRSSPCQVVEKGQIVRVEILKVFQKKVVAQLIDSQQIGIIYREEIPEGWIKRGKPKISTEEEYKAEVLSINPNSNRLKLSLSRPLKNNVSLVQGHLLLDH